MQRTSSARITAKLEQVTFALLVRVKSQLDPEQPAKLRALRGSFGLPGPPPPPPE